MVESSRHLTIPIRSDKFALSVKVTRTVCSVQTEFQNVEIIDTDCFGRVLLLDGHIQLTELDEQAYHECLVQIPLSSIPNPESALVIGGGDGGVIRELCKHESIRRIDMVEIDSRVIELSKEHLPFVSAGAFDDSRVHVRVEDAFGFVKHCDESYDLIVVDCTDLYEEEDGGLSEMLFTNEFYADCNRVLSEKGMLVSQADNLVFCPYSLEQISKMFSAVFPVVGSYQAVIPSFGGFSGYCYASKGQRLAPDYEAKVNCAYLNEETYAFANRLIKYKSIVKD